MLSFKVLFDGQRRRVELTNDFPVKLCKTNQAEQRKKKSEEFKKSFSF